MRCTRHRDMCVDDLNQNGLDTEEKKGARKMPNLKIVGSLGDEV